ncbi:hypothetical protein GUJ93_ZPchr0006g45841 [Zizania palustris]|uniref:Knottin scorpion toxin-like domain-containing protein n=1 Tax=Zizania palustris TaxID=103762 RepID=A0A8J5SMN5_ZIZPA|nr:hypothetical protein GUJ93_ZPchr0006g45841 [Zizania palustris]
MHHHTSESQRRQEEMKTSQLLALFVAFAVVLVAEASSASDKNVKDCRYTRVLPVVACEQNCQAECTRRHPDGVGVCVNEFCACSYDCTSWPSSPSPPTARWPTSDQ